MKSKVLFFAIVFGAYCCNKPQRIQDTGNFTPVSVSITKNGNMLYTLPLDSLKPVRRILPISKLVEDCSLVQLENKNNTPLEGFLFVTPKYICVSKNVMRICELYDRTGKYLSTVGGLNFVH